MSETNAPGMSEKQRAELLAIGDEFEAAHNGPWQPRCVVEALGSPRAGAIAFTIQAWVDLDRAKSPLLLGELPATRADLDAACAVFDLDIDGSTPDAAAAIAEAMRDAIRAGFAMSLPMKPPGDPQDTATPDGFGEIAPMWACLVTQCGVSPAEAMAMQVGQAHLLIASHRRNQGWQPVGDQYAVRDMRKAESSAPAASDDLPPDDDPFWSEPGEATEVSNG